MKIIAYGIREDERPYVRTSRWTLSRLNWPRAAMVWLPTSRKATRLTF